MSDSLKDHQSKAGQKGGRSRSDAKRAAVKANLAKARQHRWPGREQAAIAAAKAAEIGGERAASCVAEALDNVKNAETAADAGDEEEAAIQTALANINMIGAMHNARMRNGR